MIYIYIYLILTLIVLCKNLGSVGQFSTVARARDLLLASCTDNRPQGFRAENRENDSPGKEQY